MNPQINGGTIRPVQVLATIAMITPTEACIEVERPRIADGLEAGNPIRSIQFETSGSLNRLSTIVRFQNVIRKPNFASRCPRNAVAFLKLGPQAAVVVVTVLLLNKLSKSSDGSIRYRSATRRT